MKARHMIATSAAENNTAPEVVSANVDALNAMVSPASSNYHQMCGLLLSTMTRTSTMTRCVASSSQLLAPPFWLNTSRSCLHCSMLNCSMHDSHT
jgi:hypothetical protein